MDNGPLRQFWSDLSWAVKSSAASPIMAVTILLSAGVAALGALNGRRGLVGLELFGLLLVPFNIGFVGTQRVWFLLRSRQQTMTGEEIWSLSWGFFWRYLRLGLLVLALEFLIDAVVNPLAGHNAFIWATVVTGVVSDLLLTFVVPSLALHSDSVVEAVRLGARLTVRSWPTCWPYLLTPGITLVAIAQAWGTRRGGLLPAVVTATVGGVLGLWFKGAIVGLFLRVVPDAQVAHRGSRVRRRPVGSYSETVSPPVMPERMPEEPSLLDITRRMEGHDDGEKPSQSGRP